MSNDDGIVTKDAGASPEFGPRISIGVSQARRRLGYFLLFLSIVLVVGALGWSLVALDRMKPTPSAPAAFDYVKLAVHGAITIGFIFFCYTLMQAGERLAIPSELIRTPEDLRILLGVRTPISAAKEELAEIVKIIAPIAELAKPGGESKE